MKKRLSLASLGILLFACLQAQIPKGSILLGGDLSLGIGKLKTNGVSRDQNNIYFAPVFAKAIKENLFVGGTVGFGKNKDDQGIYTYNTDIYSAGVFIRKYKSIKNGFYIFGQGNLGGTYTKRMYETGDLIYSPSTEKNTTIGISVTPGISYAISKKFHLEAGFNNLLSLNYTNNKTWTGPSGSTIYTKRNAVALNSSLNNMSSQLFMGFRVLLEKNKK